MTEIFTQCRKGKLMSLILTGTLFLFLSNLSLSAQTFTVSVTGTNPTCSNFTDGTLTATATGGWPPYTYQWSSGHSGPSVFGVGAGTYTVTVTDIDGAITTGSTTLTAPSGISVTASLTGDPCTAPGDITAAATGGTGTYTYVWDNGVTAQSQSGLPAGLYCVTATDGSGCAAVSCITVSGGLSVDVTTVDSQCGGVCDGSANAHVSGGTPPYTYAWNQGGNTPTIAPLPKGTYTVTVTDVNGCTATGTGIVDEPSPVVLSLNITQPDCQNGSGGAIAVNPSGGVPPYAYGWSTGATSNSISGLSAGSYTVSITDANNCASDTTIVLTGGSLNLIATATDVTCGATNDGSATATASGGTPPYSYSWSNGMNGATINNLTTGTYIVTASDSGSCTATYTVTVAGGGPNINVNATSTDVSCNGANNGSATASATGGNGTYTYSWSNGMMGASITNIGPGSYTVTVDDGTGCSSTATVTVDQPQAINLNATATDETCPDSNDGSATATATGGNGGFTYNWSNGSFGATISNLAPGTYTVTATDNSGCSEVTSVQVATGSGPSLSVSSTDILCFGDQNGTATATVAGGGSHTYSWSNGMTTQTISGLGAGTYSVTVTDGNGCTAIGSTTITAPSAAVTANASITQQISSAGAGDGAATVTASGGTPSYTYAWSNGASTQSITNLGPGTYIVTVTDANGCTDTSAVSLRDPVPPCDNFTDAGTIGNNQTYCGPVLNAAPFVELTPATGGSGTVTYLWMMSTSSTVFSASTFTAIPNSNSRTYNPGVIEQTTYFARCVKRANCDFIETEVISIVIEDPSLAEINSDDVFCPGESITFTATDAGPGASYSWDFGGTATPNTSNQRSVDVVFNGNNPGPRISLTVTANGCTASRTKKVTALAPGDCPPSIILRTSVNNFNQVLTEWSSLLPEEDYIFEVMKSADGTNFSPLHEMNAKGNGTEMSYFDFLDKAPKKGHSVYQIRATRLSDGTVIVSEPSNVRVAWGTDNSFIYPNPSQDLFVVERLESFDSEGTIEILNIKGQVITSSLMNVDQVRKEIQISDLDAGVYLIRVTYKDSKKPEVHRFIKR